MRIACIGDNCIDWYDGIEKGSPGGNPVNVAVYARRLGAESSYIGAVGSDAGGEIILRALAGKGVDTSHVRTLPGSTAVSHVTLKDGERVFGDYDEGVMADFRPDPEDIDFICGHDIAVTSLWGHSEGALAQIRAAGVPVAYDAAERPFSSAALAAAPDTDIFFFSDDTGSDCEVMEELRRVRSLGPGTAVAMRGKKGSMAMDGESFFRFGIIPCAVRDTMGAGDSYIAGFLDERLRGSSVPECMMAGAACAAETLGHPGAW